MKVYIAGPFFKQDQLDNIKSIEDILDGMGIEYFSPRSFGILGEMTQEEKQKRAKEIYNKNIEQIHECDFMIAVIDDFDTGTVFEIGFASALNKAIVTYSPAAYGLNIMLKASVIYHAKDTTDLCDAIRAYRFGDKMKDLDFSDTH